MGKPFSIELARLPETYAWAKDFAIDPIADALRPAWALPAVAVGSGGSFTVAQLASALHRQFTGQMAHALTPMEAVSSPVAMRSIAVMMLTAGGRNPDVLGSFRQLVTREPREFFVFCTSKESPLATLAARYCYVRLIQFDLPSGKDGFLATNSLVASGIILTRAYAHLASGRDPLPASLGRLLSSSNSGAQEQLVRRFSPLWGRQTLVVLYGPKTRVAAVDLESKFTEAALGSVQVADYRNFAHGRHHWLAKRGSETGVLAFVTEDDRDIAKRTLAHLPESIPVVRIEIPHSGISAGIAALIQGLYVVGSAGQARGIDPGVPRVPVLGRKIYHLRAFGGTSRLSFPCTALEAVAIERKSGETVASLAARGELSFWKKAYASFVQKIRRAVFYALVVDYDGTLCDAVDRFRGLQASASRTWWTRQSTSAPATKVRACSVSAIAGDGRAMISLC